MKTRRFFVWTFSFFFAIVFTLSAAGADAASLSDTLRTNLAALKQTAPGSSQERALQKKIIGLVRKMKNKPLLTDAVERHMARGETFVETARSKSGFALAIREFRAVTRLVPWIAQGHYNLGVVQGKAGQFDAAMASFRMYIFSMPQSFDPQKVKRLIYKIEARKEAAAAQAAGRRKQEQARLQQERERRQQAENRRQEMKRRRERERKEQNIGNLAGMWCNKSRGNGACIWRLTPKGSSFELRYVSSFGGTKHYEIYQVKVLEGGRIEGKKLSGMLRYGKCGNRPVYYSVPVQGKLSRGRTSMILSYTTPVRSSLHSTRCRWTHSSKTISWSNRFVPQ